MSIMVKNDRMLVLIGGLFVETLHSLLIATSEISTQGRYYNVGNGLHMEFGPS